MEAGQGVLGESEPVDKRRHLIHVRILQKSFWSLRTEQTTRPPDALRLSDCSHLLPLGLLSKTSKMPPKNKGKKGKKGGDDDDAFWCVLDNLHAAALLNTPRSQC